MAILLIIPSKMQLVSMGDTFVDGCVYDYVPALVNPFGQHESECYVRKLDETGELQFTRSITTNVSRTVPNVIPQD
eukprot:6491503-Amphidinium_carterae.1